METKGEGLGKVTLCQCQSHYFFVTFHYALNGINWKQAEIACQGSMENANQPIGKCCLQVTQLIMSVWLKRLDWRKTLFARLADESYKSRRTTQKFNNFKSCPNSQPNFHARFLCKAVVTGFTDSKYNNTFRARFS